MGLLSKISGIASKTSKKSARKQRRIETTTHNVNKNRLQREEETFMEDAQRQRLMLNERLAARGMSQGTHAMEERRIQEGAIKRGLGDIGDRSLLADLGADASAYTQKTRNRANPLTILDFATELAQTGIGLGIGGGAELAGAGSSGLGDAFLDY